MEHRAFEQIRDGGKADVRMRAHVEVVVRGHGDRPEVIEEDEGTHPLAGKGREQAADEEAAPEILGAAGVEVIEGHRAIIGEFSTCNCAARTQNAHAPPDEAAGQGGARRVAPSVCVHRETT